MQVTKEFCSTPQEDCFFSSDRYPPEQQFSSLQEEKKDGSGSAQVGHKLRVGPSIPLGLNEETTTHKVMALQQPAPLSVSFPVCFLWS